MASPKLIALFFAFAMAAAAALQPSEAARVVQAQQQAFKPAAAAGQEAAEKVALTDQQAAAGVPVPRPSTTTTPPAGAIIGLLQPLIPPPGSSLPLQAGTGTQPTECMTPLAGMLPCTDYLTNITVLTPPGECCDGLRSIIRDAPICLRRGMNGDMDQFLPKPVDRIRMTILSLACGTMLPIQTLFACNSHQVPPIMPPTPAEPPMTPPSVSP